MNVTVEHDACITRLLQLLDGREAQIIADADRNAPRLDLAYRAGEITREQRNHGIRLLEQKVNEQLEAVRREKREQKRKLGEQLLDLIEKITERWAEELEEVSCADRLAR